MSTVEDVDVDVIEAIKRSFGGKSTNQRLGHGLIDRVD
jgi:hypothetical protein